MQQKQKGYFHSTTLMHIFLRGFLRGRQKSALMGLSGGGLPPRLAGLFGADLEAAAAVAPAPAPVCDCGCCALPSCASPPAPNCCWPTTGGVALKGVAAAGWTPGSPVGPSAEPPSPPALIGRWCRAPCFPSDDDLASFFSFYGDAPAVAVAASAALPRRQLTPIDAVSQRRPTTRCSSPACYGTGLLRSSLRDLRQKVGVHERGRETEND